MAAAAGRFVPDPDGTGRGDDKANVVSTATAGASGHLLQFGRTQRSPPAAGSCVGPRKHHGAGRKIDAGGDRCGGKDRVEQTGAHQFLDH